MQKWFRFLLYAFSAILPNRQKENPGRSRGKCAGDLVTAGICRGQEPCDTRRKDYRKWPKRPAQRKRNARRSGRARMATICSLALLVLAISRKESPGRSRGELKHYHVECRPF